MKTRKHIEDELRALMLRTDLLPEQFKADLMELGPEVFQLILEHSNDQEKGSFREGVRSVLSSEEFEDTLEEFLHSLARQLIPEKGDDWKWEDVAIALTRRGVCSFSEFMDMSSERRAALMIHSRQGPLSNETNQSGFPWDSVELTEATKRVANLAWISRGHSISFVDASDDHAKPITKHSANRIRRNFNEAMADTKISISLAKEHFTIICEETSNSASLTP